MPFRVSFQKSPASRAGTRPPPKTIHGLHSLLNGLFAVLIFPPLLLAQVSRPETGVVEDETGAAIHGAAVTLLRQDRAALVKLHRQILLAIDRLERALLHPPPKPTTRLGGPPAEKILQARVQGNCG